MKLYTVVLSLALVMLLQINASSQIPNAGFENWTMEDPDGWTTFDFFANSVSQSSDNHSGSSAAKMEIVDSGGNPVYSFMFADSIGVSERHGSLNGYYKFIPQSDNDVLDILVIMYDGSVFNFIGGGFLELGGTVSTYTQFSVPITYSSSETPDTAWIEFVVVDTSKDGSGGIGSYALIDDLSFGGPTGVEPVDQIPSAYLLKQNYPNPFNPSTTIEFSIPEESFVEVKVYNILGKEVATLAYNTYSSGSYKVDFNGEDLSSGIYIAKINATAKDGNFNFSKSLKMTLLK